MPDSQSANRKRRLLVLRQTGQLRDVNCAGPETGSAADRLAVEFLQACGLSSYLRFQLSPAKGQPPLHCVVDRPFVLVGRHPRCDVRLEHADISGRHVYLQAVEQRVYCFDLESRTGVVWGAGWQQAGVLNPGAPLHIGPSVLELCANEFEPLPEFVAPPEPQPFAFALVFPNASPRLPPWLVRNRITLIGRSPICRVQLNDQSVSRFHASLVWTDSGLWVVDLLSRERTHVNGRPIEFARLRPGDRLTVGKFRIEIHGASERQIIRKRRALTAASNGTPPAPPTTAPSEPLPGMIRQSAAVATVCEARDDTVFDRAFVMGLIREFAGLQQQMLERTQQQMQAAVEQLTNAQQQQLTPLREELRELRELVRTALARSQTASGPEVSVPLDPPKKPTAGVFIDQSPEVQFPEVDLRSSSGPVADFDAVTELPDGVSTGLESWSTDRLAAMQQELDRYWQQLDGEALGETAAHGS